MSSPCDTDKLASGDFWLGALVRSLAGHDAGRIYLVVGHDLNEYSQRLYLVDGHYRSWLSPKAKNPKQLQFLEQALDGESLWAIANLGEGSGAREAAVRSLIKRYCEGE